MRRVRLHRHRDLGLHVGFAEVHLAGLAVLEANRDHGVRLAVFVADDGVRLAELGRQLVVGDEVLEELPERVVDLLGVLEVGQVPPSRDPFALTRRAAILWGGLAGWPMLLP